MKTKKSNTCLFCKRPKSKNEFINSYDYNTACKTLTIKCIFSPNPCPGWTYTYGVMFNVYKYVHELRQKIEKLKILLFKKIMIIMKFIIYSII